MSTDQAIIDWLIDALPDGWEWMGLPIVGAILLLVPIAAAFAIWAAWKSLTKMVRDWNK